MLKREYVKHMSSTIITLKEKSQNINYPSLHTALMKHAPFLPNSQHESALKVFKKSNCRNAFCT